MADFRCKCGGELRRIGWQEMYRNSGRGAKTAAQAAFELLVATGNPAIGWGDSGLLHQVAEKLGMPHEGPLTERKVMRRIEASHQGVLVKRLLELPNGRAVRRYWLPNQAPNS